MSNACALNSSRIAGFDGLRVLAVLAVMANHGNVIGYGFGLQILLVLSGFLTTRMLLTEHARSGHIKVSRFVWRRFARLSPALFAYLAVGVVYLMVRDKPVPWGAVLSVMGQFINLYQGLTGGQGSFVSHTWSMSLQEQFFIVWPLMFAFVLKTSSSTSSPGPSSGQSNSLLSGMGISKAARLLPLSIVLWIIAVWVIRAVECVVLEVPDAYIYRAFETRTDGLAMGGLMAVLMQRKSVCEAIEDLRPFAGVITLMCAISLFVVLDMQDHSAFDKYVVSFSLIPMIVCLALPFVIMMASSSSRHDLVARVLQSKLMTALAQVSYAAYLAHQILMHAIISVLDSRGLHHTASFAVAAAACFAAGYASWRWYETPARGWLEAAPKRLRNGTDSWLKHLSQHDEQGRHLKMVD